MSVDHYENFPVASVLCPPALRPCIVAIYHFARTADDLADEGQATPAQRREDLQVYRDDLHAVYRGGTASERWRGLFERLAVQVQRHALPLAPLDALLDAFEQDTHNPRYADRKALLAYCSRSANPIGRLLLHLYGLTAAVDLARADAVCTALQLINFWQDLSIDGPRGRCYVPLEDAERHGLTPDDILGGQDSPAARAMIQELSRWAAELMHQGAPLAMCLPGRAGWEMRLVVQGGLRVLEKIRHMDHATLKTRPKLNGLDVPLLAWRACRMGWRAA